MSYPYRHNPGVQCNKTFPDEKLEFIDLGLLHWHAKDCEQCDRANGILDPEFQTNTCVPEMNYLRDGTIKPRLIQSDGVRRDATGAAGLGRTVGDRTVSTFSALPTSAPKRPKIPTLAVGYGKAFPYG